MISSSHENGVVECANGSLKKRLAQQLSLRGHSDFDGVAHYQAFIDRVVDKLNQRNRSRALEEQAALQPLPEFTAAEYQTLHLKVTRSSTIEVRRVVYTVPSRLIGESVHIRLHHDKRMLFVDQQPALTLPRIYPRPGESRARVSNLQLSRPGPNAALPSEHFGFLFINIVAHIPKLHSMLNVQPEFRGITKRGRQFDCHGSSQRSFIMHKSAQGISVNAHRRSQLADLNMHRLQKFDRQHLTNRYRTTLCIPHSFYLH
nr:hypothetical protein [Marinobacter gelidimuriae]